MIAHISRSCSKVLDAGLALRFLPIFSNLPLCFVECHLVLRHISLRLTLSCTEMWHSDLDCAVHPASPRPAKDRLPKCQSSPSSCLLLRAPLSTESAVLGDHTAMDL